MSKPIRVAHLVSHPIQYYVPLYRELSLRDEIDITVYFYSDFSLRQFTDKEFNSTIQWDIPLLEGYKYHFCQSAVRRDNKHLERSIQWDLIMELIKGKYDVIWVMSYSSMNAVTARFLALITGAKIFFRDDTNLLTPRPLWKMILKKAFLKPFLTGAFGLYVGEANRNYWNYYGIKDSRLWFTPHHVDNDFFCGRSNELLPKKNLVRQSFGINNDAPVILFCGKFIPKKQPKLILAAYELLRKETNCWLLMVGDGILKDEIIDLICKKSIPNVIVTGFMNQTQISNAYAAADLLALPSANNETWGLVVNEAMNFGLPIVVSDRVGCANDLVKNAYNGYIFPHDSELDLLNALRALVTNKTKRQEFGSLSKVIVKSYSVSTCADGILEAFISSKSEEK